MVEVKTDSLIRTKLHLPFTRQSLVTRSRLQARVLEGLHGPLTLVIAPAGFGKSTLAASSVTKAGWPGIARPASGKPKWPGSGHAESNRLYFISIHSVICEKVR